MTGVRFQGVPRAELNRIIGDMEGWRNMGHRMLEHVKDRCPVSSDEDGAGGEHLRDTLEVRFITGSDPRILIGSSRKGDVLTYLTQGTSDHFVAPVNASVLRWTSGGTTFFSAGHMVSGIKASSFLLDAVREIAQMP
jgi:hypothetical protein